LNKNMKNLFFNKIIGAFGIISLLSMASCVKDGLNTKPVSSLSDADAFATPDRFLSQVNGFYDALKNDPISGRAFISGRYQIYQDIRGEEFLNELSNAVTGFTTWNHTALSGTNEVNNIWIAAYYAINSCNIFLDGAPLKKSILNNEALLNNYLAEARFVRALCYYNLVIMYARPYLDGNGSKLGVPLRLTGAKDDSNNDLARSTVAEIYTAILADLNFAEQNLPASYATPLLSTTRAHKNTAIALKTRVYLSMGKYAEVITEANKIVPAVAPFKAATGVLHQLQPTVAAVFATPYTTVESIFSLPMSDTDLPGTQNGLCYYWSPSTTGNGEYTLNGTIGVGIAADSVNWRLADTRRALHKVVGTKRYLNKFPTGPNHTDFVPIIRYAEVLLNAAEAIARTAGVDARAIALLNAVRQRADAGITFAAADFADGAALANGILRERRIELLGEGFRAADCMRLLLTIPGKSGANGNVPAIPSTNAVYAWPIPQVELLANKLCVP
jgi:starch-binding outer membrane protein, SusD/RagB family